MPLWDYSCFQMFDNILGSPWSKETAWLQSDGGPDVLLAGVVLHHDGETLLVILLPEHGPATLRVAGDGESVGDVVADQLAPDGGQPSEMLVWVVLLSQDPGRHEQRVRERPGHPGLPGGAHTCSVQSVCVQEERRGHFMKN